MKAEFVAINPAKAQAFLDATTTKNRAVNKNAVETYIAVMKAGKWQANGEPIIIDDNGNVIDGQHRLHAIIRSNSTHDMLVVRGVDPSAFKTIDSGRKRRHYDLLSIANVSDPSMTSAAVAGIYSFEKTGTLSTQKSPAFSYLTHRGADYDPVAEAISRMPLLNESVRVGRKWRKRVPSKVTPSLVSTMHYVFSKKSEDDANRFFDNIIEMNFGGDDDPVKRIHRSCTDKERSVIVSANCRYAGAIFIKAWNHYRRGSTCGALGFKDNEAFPKPI